MLQCGEGQGISPDEMYYRSHYYDILTKYEGIKNDYNILRKKYDRISEIYCKCIDFLAKDNLIKNMIYDMIEKAEHDDYDEDEEDEDDDYL